MSDISKIQEDIRYKIGIGLIPKIGPVLTKRLIAYCGSAEGVFHEKKARLSKIPGIGEKLATHDCQQQKPGQGRSGN